jgi:hypothetical protein
MTEIPKSLLDQIRSSDVLVQLIAEAGFPLHGNGSDLRGDCPFEATRSSTQSKFHVQLRGGASPGWKYTCYGCNESGDVFTFIGRFKGVATFAEQVTAAAEMAGIPLPRQQLRPKSKKRESREAALEALHALSREIAGNLPPEQQQIGSVPLGDLIASGEVGLMPGAAAIKTLLAKSGVTGEQLRQLAAPGAMRAIAGQWVLWKIDGGRPTLCRPVQHEPHTEAAPHCISATDAATSGWILPATEPHSRDLRSSWYGVACDDILYLSLRSNGFAPVAVPVSAASYSRPAIRDGSPVLLIRPEDVSRRVGRTLGVRLLEASPRLRVAEVSPAPAPGTDVEGWREMVSRAARRSDIMLDWATQFVIRHIDLNTPQGRRRAALALSEIVQCTKAPLERAVYAAEVLDLTGIDVGTGGQAEARTSGRKPATARRQVV